jgi:nucleotide-binding universal stress UspA family protein
LKVLPPELTRLHKRPYIFVWQLRSPKISSETERQQLHVQHQQAAEAYLKKMVTNTRFEGAVLSYEVLGGKVADTLAHWAEKNEVDLIVIASHGRSGVSRWILGSVAERVLRSACVPVLMIRAPGCFPGI